MTESNPHIKDYYDDFVGHLVQDFIQGNPRLEVQYDFIRDSLSPMVNNVLIIGCGSGESAYLIASKFAPRAQVLAVDISSENIKAAESLFKHDRITYRVMDVTQELPDGRFDIILLPDVYEHIPRESRGSLHASLQKLLSPHGLILITIPSQSHQENLIRLGTGLQVIDEIVSMEDLQLLARDIDGHLVYYCLVNVFKKGDYVHAIISAGAEVERKLSPFDQINIRRGNRRPGGLKHWVGGLSRRLARRRNARRVRSKLGASAIKSAVNKLEPAANDSPSSSERQGF